MSLEFKDKANTFLHLLRSGAQLGSSFFYMQRPFLLNIKESLQLLCML